jgi:Zn-dependent M28 family amino/carboxypeptidase
MMLRAALSTVLVAGALACSGQASIGASQAAVAAIDSARVLADLRHLSGPAMAGRATGTPGNAAARAYIEAELRDAGVLPLGGDWLHSFTFVPRQGGNPLTGHNVVGYLEGTQRPDRYIVVTAHYDHLGVRNGEIYHGADDNASGTAALLEIARFFADNPPRNSLVFAALDAEEMGLRGARALVAAPPIPLASIVLNVNLDMVSRSEADELFAAGTYHYPFLTPLVERVAARAPLTLLRGHDSPDLPPVDDWTFQSDHGAFHEVGIPFVYFGVEDHADYHRPTDTFENIDPAFFVRAVATVLDFVGVADEELDGIEARSVAASHR